MQTEKLFYRDSMLRQFSARVVSCEQTEKGYLVTLDRTAFYPEGGGQACDIGVLGTANVTDVQEAGEQILHLCDSPLPVGQEVEGVIDWQRRFDLMQQHTGEHILSGLIHARFGYQNSGFHVGAEVMEVDFDGPISPEEIRELEEAANQAVWDNLPVTGSYPDREELPHIFYRTKRPLPWPVRIVEIPGVDSCACCGVHVEHTGQVGLIKIISCVKFHSGVRLEMVCGARAYRYTGHIFEQNRKISQLLSAKMTDTAAAAQKLWDTCAAEKYRAAGLEKQVFQAIAEGYTSRRNVLHFASDLSGIGVRELAEAIADRVTGAAVVCSGDDTRGYQICLVSRTTAVRELGTEAVKALEGRGGGKEYAFQGTVSASKNRVEDFFAARW